MEFCYRRKSRKRLEIDEGGEVAVIAEIAEVAVYRIENCKLQQFTAMS